MQFELVKKMIHEAINCGSFPSAVFAIGVGDTLLCREAYGSLDCADSHNQVNAETLYDMASITKILVTTMLAAAAVESGKISLHEPIGNFLERVPGDKSEITLFHLLTHTSGIAAHIMFSDYLTQGEDCVSFILSRPLVKPVGEDTIYSCLGFIVLGGIIERVMGDRLDILADKYVFSKLGMKDTCYNPYHNLPSNLPSNPPHNLLRNPHSNSSSANIAATEFDPSSNQYLCGVVHDENARFLGGVSANAGVFSNIDDMARFASMLSSQGRIDGRAYMSKACFDMFTKNHTSGKSESRGLGFSVFERGLHPAGDLFSVGSFGHTGFTGTSVFVDKASGLYVVLLTNRVHLGRNNIRIIDFRRRFHNAVISEFQKM